MTKKELFEIVERKAWGSNYDTWHRLYTCSAQYKQVDDDLIVLKSYATIVAVLDTRCGTLYVRDYYSQTTCQHVSKFGKLFRDFVSRYTYLYRRSDRIIEKGITEYANTHKLTKAQHDFHGLQLDYSTFIRSSIA